MANTPLLARTRRYWREVGGLLIEEFHAIKGDKSHNVGKRAIDGVIVLGEPEALQCGGTHDFQDKDLIVIQTKSGRLGMYLMGQAYFSREIMRRFSPRSIRTVAICGTDDTEMSELCSQADIEVCVTPEGSRPLTDEDTNPIK
ncbi:hypothetical protein N9Z15_00405 [Akkermansiaceae bacterium]|nr:hypothetical protein [Akkermansiaceae bacterium]